MDDQPAAADASVVIDLTAIRRRVIDETFGGPNMYALLEKRNPEIKLLLNAGIVAGLHQSAAT